MLMNTQASRTHQHMRTHLHKHSCIHIHTQAHTITHTHMQYYENTHTHTCTYTRTYEPTQNPQVHTHTRVCAGSNTRTNTRTHTHAQCPLSEKHTLMHTCTNAMHTLTNTHTSTLAHKQAYVTFHVKMVLRALGQLLSKHVIKISTRFLYSTLCTSCSGSLIILAYIKQLQHMLAQEVLSILNQV